LRERDIVSETEFERSGVTLAECLQLFSAEERLTKENQWYCPKCKKWQEASKKLDIWWPPPILIIHLKRFAYTHWYRSKLDIFVDFPLEGLDLRGYVLGSPLTLSSTTTSTRSNESLLYDLYAVINHYGTLGGGHYTAIVKRVGVDNNMRWYHFDDTCISPITDPQHEIVTSAAYILFYKRRDLDFLSFLSSSSHSSSIISEDNSQSSLDCIDTNQLHSFHSSPQQQQQQQ
jgi:ubiquitin carboxyl-terminal hydrolase 4/11/15